MEYLPLGSTGLTVSRIGFGCGDRAGLFVRGSRHLQEKAVDKALECGITFFDTAAKYGGGASEANLGAVLASRGADVVVGTKVALDESEVEELDVAVRRSAEGSLAQLRTDGIGLFQLHNRIDRTQEHATAARRSGRYPDGGSPILTLAQMLDPGGVLETLLDLKKSGKVNALGLTAFGGNPEAIREVIATGVFDAVNCSLHMLNPSAVLRPPAGWRATNYDAIGRHAAEAGLGVLAIRALAGGKLTGSSELHPNARPVGGDDPDAVLDNEVAARVQGWVRRTGAPLPLAALRFTLAWRPVTTVVCGFSGPEHIDDAVEAVRIGSIAETAVEEWATELMSTVDERHE